jgi:hypothetical protein
LINIVIKYEERNVTLGLASVVYDARKWHQVTAQFHHFARFVPTLFAQARARQRAHRIHVRRVPNLVRRDLPVMPGHYGI